MEALEDALPLINQYAKPKAIIKWATVDSVVGNQTTIDGVTFISRIVADKMKGLQRTFLSVITEGDSLESSEELEDDPFLDTYKGAVLAYAGEAVVRYMKDELGFDGSSMLNPGSLPDWPISANAALLDLIGNVSEIGITINRTGYMTPWNSGSHIHFAGNGYQNCSLCKKLTCINRRAAFDAAEYKRIFGDQA